MVAEETSARLLGLWLMKHPRPFFQKWRLVMSPLVSVRRAELAYGDAKAP
jgi:hypothetical protein